MARINLNTRELEPYREVAEGGAEFHRRVRFFAIQDFRKHGDISPDIFTNAIFGRGGGLKERHAKEEWEKITIDKRMPLVNESREISEELRTFRQLSQKFSTDIKGIIRPYAGINTLQRRRARIKLELNAAMSAARMGKAAYNSLKAAGKPLKGAMKEAYLNALIQFARRASLPVPSYTEEIGMATTRYTSRW